MTKVMRFVLKAAVGALATRDQGARNRKEMEDALDKFGEIEVVLDSVGSMTPSFVDECLGKLLVRMGKKDFKKRVHLIANGKDAKLLVNRVLADRLRSHTVTPKSD